MLWRMHSPRKEQACFLPPMNWVKMDQSAWAVQQRISATRKLAAQAAPRSVSAHPEDVFACSTTHPETCTHHPGKCFQALTGPGGQRVSLPCVCENSTPARGALDCLRSTICPGPRSSHPSDPVRVGHQMLHESHRLRFHRGVCWCTSCGRAVGLVNECPGYQARAGRDVLARIERGLSPKASPDWPLMRDTVSVNMDSTPNSHPGHSWA